MHRGTNGLTEMVLGIFIWAKEFKLEAVRLWKSSGRPAEAVVRRFSDSKDVV